MLFSALLLMAPPEPITIVNSTVAGIKTRAIVADMNDPRIRWGVVVATVFPGGDQDFKSMFTGSGAIAAINGTYFDKYNKRPIGDLVIGGRTVYEGRRGTAFTMTPDRQFKMFRVVRDRSYAWGSYESVIACGPALMLDGKVNVDPKLEGFRDPSIFGKIRRMGVGYTKAGKLMLVHCLSGCDFQTQAKVFEGLGCYEAMNLDAGASLAMAYRGQILAAPGRKLTNIIALWQDPPAK
jgi:exopolysaccharide biosynthesis protein